MTRFGAVIAALGALFLLPYAVIPAFAPEGAGFWQHVFVTIFIFAAMSSAWNIVGGFAGQLSLGHMLFYGLGAYVAVGLSIRFGLPPWIGGIAGAALSAVVGVLLAWPTLRLRGPFYTLSTIAVLQVARLLAIHEAELTGGSAGLPVPMFADGQLRIGWAWMLFREKENYLVIAFGLLLAALGVSWWVKRSRLGLQLVAIREREDAARAVGVNTTLAKLLAVAISAALTSVIGTFGGIYSNYLDPDSMFSLPSAISVAMFALIGGLGTVAGPLLGTLLVVPIAEAARGWLGAAANGLHGLVYGIVLVAVVLTMPRGIVGTLAARMQGWRGGAGRTGVTLAPIRPAPETTRPPIGEPILEARGLTRRFGGLVATDDVSLTLREGEVIGIIGPNGAGKTTLFNLLSGFLRPSAGTIRVRSASGWQSPRAAHRFARAGVGRTFQIVQPFAGMTVRENIMLGAFAGGGDAEAEADRVAELVGLHHLRDIPARQLTVGGLKRLEVARALAMRPRVLLLDEVMAGLNPADVAQAVELVRRVRDSGVSIIAIEHVMAAIMAISDRVVVISSGRVIAEGTPSAIAQDKAVIEAYLGEDYVAQAA